MHARYLERRNVQVQHAIWRARADVEQQRLQQRQRAEALSARASLGAALFGGAPLSVAQAGSIAAALGGQVHRVDDDAAVAPAAAAVLGSSGGGSAPALGGGSAPGSATTGSLASL